jgi:hypothetical protein
VIAFRLFLAFVFLPIATHAADDRYEIFARTITPFLAVFAKDRKSEDRAFSMKLRLEQGTDIPAEFVGAEAEIAVQAPDKARLRGPLLGERFTLVRDDEKLWIYPGAKARALLDAATAGKELPPPDKKFRLGEFKLPFPEKQLIFLAALFSIKDHGSEMLEGAECRALDVQLMPQLAESLKADGWVARMWIRPEMTPARITLARKGWNVVLRVDDVRFAKELPGSIWSPSVEEAGDVLELKPKEYSRFLRAIAGSKGK